MLEFIRTQHPRAEVAALEVGSDDKEDLLWCKVHRSEETPTRGGGYLFTVSYLDRVKASAGDPQLVGGSRQTAGRV
jgi:hypothetical protein